MIDVEFVVDENMIASCLLTSSRLKMLMPSYYQDLKLNGVEFLDSNKIIQLPNCYVEELKRNKQFKDIVKLSADNKIRLERIFNNNKQKIFNFLFKVLKTDEINLPKQTVFVFDYHIQMGRNIGENKILFGLVDENKNLNDNYDLTYLIHEILHSVLTGEDIDHTLIENIADYELCKKLNNSSWHYRGHESKTYSLVGLHKKIYPYWNIYLNKSLEEIRQDIDFARFEYNIDEFEPLRQTIRVMNIFEFRDYLNTIFETK